MTRKDYEMIAATIREAQVRVAETVPSDAEASTQLRGVRRAAAHLATAFMIDNSRFDTVRFLKACGYGA